MPLAAQIVYVVFTLYMLAILLRWLGPWISFDFDEHRLAWAGRLTDPLVGKIREILPPLGPFDAGPIAALLAVWILRELTIAVTVSAMTASV